MPTATPCTHLDIPARVIREPQVPNADWDSGMNWGSCAGIGVAVGPVDFREDREKWTLIDQYLATRTPQESQSIGGIAIGAGSHFFDDREPLRFVAPVDDTGSGESVSLGDARLLTLAAGWTVTP